VEGALLQKLSEPGVIKAMCAVIDSDNADLAALRAEQDGIRNEMLRLAASCDAGDIGAEQLAIARGASASAMPRFSQSSPRRLPAHRWMCCSVRNR